MPARNSCHMCTGARRQSLSRSNVVEGTTSHSEQQSRRCAKCRRKQAGTAAPNGRDVPLPSALLKMQRNHMHHSVKVSDACAFLPQAQLMMVNSVRSGTVRVGEPSLARSLFSDVMEWWLMLPLGDLVSSMLAPDQQVFGPIAKLVSLGREEDALHLMEKAGQLDRVKFELALRTGAGYSNPQTVYESTCPVSRDRPSNLTQIRDEMLTDIVTCHSKESATLLATDVSQAFEASCWFQEQVHRCEC